MAAFFRRAVTKSVKYLMSNEIQTGHYATKPSKAHRMNVDRRPTPKIHSTAESIAAKGFVRAQKEYIPPTDIDNILSVIFRDVLGESSLELDTKLSNLNQRFALFSACAEKTGHSIPNSLLHQIETIKDVVRFYSTPIDPRTPLDRMQTMELPENLHVQYEYNRFHPDTDSKFGGITAFPESSTIVTGLNYKKKYKGHIQKIRHPEI